MRETQVQSLGREDLVEKEMATHPSILAWETPWTEKPGGPQSMGSQGVGHDRATSLSLLSLGFPDSSGDKESACHARDLGLIPGLGRCPGEGNGNLFQYSCLENPIGRGAHRQSPRAHKESDTTEPLTHAHCFLLAV